MKKLISAFLALLMLFALCACGEETPDISGKYYAVSCVIDGEDMGCEGEYVKLDADGTGEVMFMDDLLDITWNLNGDSFTFTDSDGDKFVGTYADGKLTGKYATMDYVYDMNAVSSKSKAAEEAPVEEAAEEKEPAAPIGGGSFEPVVMEFSDCTVTVVGAVAVTDTNDEPAIRIYYDFTNLDDKTASAWAELTITAKQAGFELVETYNWDEIPEDGNELLDIYPNVTIRCTQDFNYNPEAGGSVSVTFDDWDDQFTVDFDAAALPGVVTEAAPIETIADPQYTAGWPTEASFDGYDLALTGDSELVESWGGAEAIRVYFNYSNTSEETQTPWFNTTIYAFQDGIRLEATSASEENAEEEAYDAELEPGASVLCAECWELISDSPVEITVSDIWDEIYVGAVYSAA